MRQQEPMVSRWTYALAFAAVLSPSFLQTSSLCQTGNPRLAGLELEVGGVNQIAFVPGQASYTVTMSSPTAILRAQSEDPAATISYQWWDGPTLIGTWALGTGDVEATLDVPEGLRMLRVHVRAPGGAYSITDIEITNSTAVAYPCTEQGIRDAIAAGGGPHYFDCEGQPPVLTASEIVINNDVILDGGGHLTIDGQNDHRVFHVYPYTVELRGMTITHGGGDVTYGGGIYNQGALTLTDVAVTDCTVTGWGGALYQHDGPSMDLVRVTLTGNTAYIGGAIGGGLGPITITDSVLSNNHVSHDGGALTTYTTTTVNGTTFSHNMGLFGGAISVRPDAAVALYDSTISGNRAQTGGGIYSYGALTIDNSVVTDNLVTHGGGGISQSEGTVALSNTTVSGNSAQFGGGIEAAAYDSSTSSLTAINTTVSGNSAQWGGGMYAAGSASVALAHVTVSGNTAGHEGSAGYGTDTVTVTYKNNLIEGTCAAGSTTGTIISYGYNIESPGNTCGLTHPTDITGVAPGSLGLGPLQDNGGLAQTHAPLSSASVAFDSVPTSACTGLGGLPLLSDQRGMARPAGLECDAGAVEGTCPDCSDGVLCSEDECDPVSQACTNPSVVCPADDVECTGDACDPATGLCNLTDGTLCESGVGQCISGVCDLCAEVTCPDDGNECTVDVCDWATGACYPPVSNYGVSCAGGAGQCVDGVCDLCMGVTCPPDGDDCTVDACDPPTGACYPPAPDGTSCDAGSGQCVAGVCDLCAGVSCPPDGNECTSDACDPSSGSCPYTALPDGALCDSGNGECLNGACDLCPGLVCDPFVYPSEPCGCDWTERMQTSPGGRGPMAYIAPGQCVGGLDVSLYDLDTNSWTPMSPANQPPLGPYGGPREGYALAYLTDDKVLMFGGELDQPGYNAFYDETWIYDLSDNAWTQAAPTARPPARTGAKMAYLGNGKVLLFGGYTGGYQFILHEDTWIYDANDQNWHLMNPTGGPPAGRLFHGMARLSDGKAMIVGGQFDPPSVLYPRVRSDFWIYDLGDGSGGSWTRGGTSTPLTGTFLVQIGEDMVMLYGGLNVYSYPPDEEIVPRDAVWVIRPPYSDLEYIGPGPYRRSGHTGCETSLNASSDIVVFDGAAWYGSGALLYYESMSDTWTFGEVVAP